MWLSDVSVRRPVLATVANLLLVVFGLAALAAATVREYPDIDPPIVSINTSYPGASAAVVETRITQVLEDRAAGIEGVRQITSSSRDGRSSINIEFELSRNIDDAANDVRDRVGRAVGELPEEADPPEIAKADADAAPILWLVLTSDRLNRLELSDYAERYLVDRFATLEGVSQVRLGGERRFAMRIWLDRLALAARGLTTEDVERALAEQNAERPAGRLESLEREFTLRTSRQFRSAQDFADLVVARAANGYPVRLGELGGVEVGPVELRSEFRANGRPALGIGIIKQSKANTLSTAQAVRAEVQRLNESLPEGMHLGINFDSAQFIEAAIAEVVRTLGWAALAVIAVIFAFLRSPRATLIPALTVPISLIASFVLLQALGFSVNILTLLALVLAVGLVVDDTIVVVENIHRRRELGEPPLLAAFRGTREVGFAVVATTIVLVAAFAPLALLEGNVGRLFREFALALAGAVLCSGFVALTLSPVLAAFLLTGDPHHDMAAAGEHCMAAAYRRALGGILRHVPMTLAIFLLAGAASWLLLRFIPQEVAPAEDRGMFFVRLTGPEGASFEYTERYAAEIERRILPRVGQGEIERVMLRIPGFGAGEQVNSGMVVVTLAPWRGRERSSLVLADELGRQLDDISGVRTVIQQRAAFGGRAGQPVQVVLGGSTFEELIEWRDKVLARARALPGLQRLDSDLKETQPQVEVQIDLKKAGDLDVPVVAIARTLETLLGGRRVTTYLDRGEEYDVMLQARRDERRNPQDLESIYVRSRSAGSLVPLANLITTRERAGPTSYNRVDRLRAVTLSAGLAPGYPLGDALDALERIVAEELPETARLSYQGESRELKEASTGLALSFAFALLVVYLVLAAQFESFIHPAAIMTTVPLAIVGALLGLIVTGSSLNVYSQIGCIMLIGLAAKNGILIVEFANQRRDQGLSIVQAVTDAAAIRLRPILMTSFSTIAGAVPLILAAGAGSESRRILGITIFGGVLSSTLLTLAVVPAFYLLLARFARPPHARAEQLAREEQAGQNDEGVPQK
jgi:multidrug efflux pump